MRVKTIMFLTVLLCWSFLRAADPAPKPLRHTRMNVLLADAIFPIVNRNDAIAAMKVVAELIAKQKGFHLDSTIEVTGNVDETAARLKQNAVDLLMLDTAQFLSLPASLVEVIAAGSKNGKLAAHSYLLLVKDLPSGKLADLRGKKIVISSHNRAGLGAMWIDVALAEQGLGRARGFFSSVEVTYKPSACVLPVFFGKADACVVDSGGWDLVRELNPQLGKLKVIAHSEPLLESAVAMPIKPHPDRNDMIAGILELHQSAAGRQLGDLFKMGPMIRARREDFESVKSLLSRYARLGPDPAAPGGAR